MSISLNMNVRPQKNAHYSLPSRAFRRRPIFMRGSHVTHDWRINETGRPHCHRPRKVVVFRSHAKVPEVKPSLSAISIIAGIVGLIAAVALVALGGAFGNPVALGMGFVVGAGGIALIVLGSITLAKSKW
jgi:hypothetical protein